MTLLTTSREPIGVAGEVSWRVSSLSLDDEAIELFGDRARRTKPEFRVTADNTQTVTEICRRLDGLPLAIELAAARVRALSPTEILDSLHDQVPSPHRRSPHRSAAPADVARFGGLVARLAEPSQNRCCSAGWRCSSAVSMSTPRTPSRAVREVERYQVLDQLTLLVDKSLVVAEDTRHGTRYRLLETVRQYAQEKLHESREGDDARTRHRDHYTAMAALLDAPADSGYQERVEWAEAEIDNLRAAFAWSRERADDELALDVGVFVATTVVERADACRKD